MDPDRPNPRERLAVAADERFYEEGIGSVGVDRILKSADAARASLSSTYGSKDELVRAYPQGRSDNWRATVAEVLPSRWSTPRERILGVFSLLTEWFDTPRLPRGLVALSADPDDRGRSSFTSPAPDATCSPKSGPRAEAASARTLQRLTADGHRALADLLRQLARHPADP